MFNIGPKGHFLWKKGTIQTLFLSVLHQNKAFLIFCKRWQHSIVERNICLKPALMQTLKLLAPFCELEQNLTFWENSSIFSKSFSTEKNPIAQLFSKKPRKMISVFFHTRWGKRTHRSGKYRPLSDFYLIMIMFWGVNNEHASESKCTYFVARKKRKM